MTRPLKGFTLIEVMIALAVFSIGALTIMKSLNQSLIHQQRLEEKTLALWLAENQISEIQLSSMWPATGIVEKTIVNGGRNWRVRTAIEDTSHASLKKIDVEVYGLDTSTAIINLVGYVGEH